MITRAVLCPLLGLSIAFAAAPAAAQQDADSSVLKIGPVSIVPTLAIRDIGRDNNVFNEATDPKSDFTMTISPKAELVLKLQRFKTTFIQTADYVYFKTYKSERGANEQNSIRSEVALGFLQPFVTASFTNSKARPDNEVDLRARHSSDVYSAGVTVKLFTRTQLTVSGRQGDAAFDDSAQFRGESLARAFDSRTRAIDTSVGIALTPLTQFALAVSNEQQRFDRAAERDADTLRIMPTFTFSPQGLLNGTAAFGYRRFTPRDPATPRFTGFVSQVSAGVTLYDHHRIDTTISRDLTYSYERASTYFINNAVGVTWTYAFAGPFESRLAAGRNVMQYHDPPGSAAGSDTYANYSAGFAYRAKPRLRLGINGDWYQRRSRRARARAFDNHRIYGTLTWGG